MVSKQTIQVQEVDEGWPRPWSWRHPGSGPASTGRISYAWRRWRVSNRNGRSRDSDLAWPALSSNQRSVSGSPSSSILSSSTRTRIQPSHDPLPRRPWWDVAPPPHGPHPPCVHVSVAKHPLTSQHATRHKTSTHDAPDPHIADAHGLP